MFSELRSQAKNIIKGYEAAYSKLTDPKLLELALKLRQEAGGSGASLVLPPAFALVREAARRELGYCHHTEQLMAAIALFRGKLVEMKTGEGKTLTITAPAFLAALAGSGIHIVTANDYLAERDCSTMGGIYARLGISCAVVTATNQYRYQPAARSLLPCSRQETYRADITYGTAPAFGFDYLRDNLVYRVEDRVQRGRHFAILDEADNILLDEARTPLIISGRSCQSAEGFYPATYLIRRLKPGRDYLVEEEKRKAWFTDEGITRLESWLELGEGQSLYDEERAELYYLELALKAQTLYHRDEDYLVRLKPAAPEDSNFPDPLESEGGAHRREDEGPALATTRPFATLTLPESPVRQTGEIVLVDRERSGRVLAGRRFRGGLHEALEAKEGLVTGSSPVTLATISLASYFGGYSHLAGLSGTLSQDKATLHKLYGVEVVEIPTHRPVRRLDKPPLVYRTRQAAVDMLVRDAVRVRESGAPVLIGTTGIGESEAVAGYLSRSGVPHLVLNARQSEQEARIIAQAGFPGRITVATGMAGRGTDIIPGGRYEDHLADMARKRGLVAQVDRGTVAWERLEQEARERTARARELVLAAGGLHVLGLGLQSSRRQELQLAGRSGRQGDPGYSRFYLSLEDELVTKTTGNSAEGIVKRRGAGAGPGKPLTGKLASVFMAECLAKQEGQHYEELRRGIEYDRVLEAQRELFYRDRQEILEAGPERLVALVRELADREIGAEEVSLSLSPAVTLPEKEPFIFNQAAPGNLLPAKPELRFIPGSAAPGEVLPVQRLRDSLLKTVDEQWIEFLTPLEELRQGIYLRTYGGREPLAEYRREAQFLWLALKTSTRRLLLDKLDHFGKVPR